MGRTRRQTTTVARNRTGPGLLSQNEPTAISACPDSPLTGAQLPIFNLPFGRVFTVHFSSELVNWSVLTNAAIGRTKPAFLINDPFATNHSSGFYSISLH
jgi:hypothetical protein